MVKVIASIMQNLQVNKKYKVHVNLYQFQPDLSVFLIKKLILIYWSKVTRTSKLKIEQQKYVYSFKNR